MGTVRLQSTDRATNESVEDDDVTMDTTVTASTFRSASSAKSKNRRPSNASSVSKTSLDDSPIRQDKPTKFDSHGRKEVVIVDDYLKKIPKSKLMTVKHPGLTAFNDSLTLSSM